MSTKDFIAFKERKLAIYIDIAGFIRIVENNHTTEYPLFLREGGLTFISFLNDLEIEKLLKKLERPLKSWSEYKRFIDGLVKL
jgi:hypothetical protein